MTNFTAKLNFEICVFSLEMAVGSVKNRFSVENDAGLWYGDQTWTNTSPFGDVFHFRKQKSFGKVEIMSFQSSMGAMNLYTMLVFPRASRPQNLRIMVYRGILVYTLMWGFPT